MPIRILLGTGMGLVTIALYLMYGVKVSSGWTTLLAGFLIGGIGIGMVNPPLATTAVGVVPVQRAGMAAGVNNTFRQVGIATGIAGLGAIFQSYYRPGGTPAQFIHGLNQILLVSTFVALVGAVLAFALVRGKDFVASGPQPAQAQAEA